MAVYKLYPSTDTGKTPSPPSSDSSPSPTDSSPSSPPSPESERSSPTSSDGSSKAPRTPSTPSSKSNSSSSPDAGLTLPSKILSGWTHKTASNTTPRRIAAATRLGAIDEDGGMSPDVPSRSSHRPISRVLNFGLTPTLYSSRQPPPYSEYSDIIGPNGEKFIDLRKNRGPPKRGGWARLLILAIIPIIIIVALAVGLGVGLSRKKSNHSTTSPSGNSTTPQSIFPLGSYSMITFLASISTACTPNPDTWRCYPYQTYNQSTTNSQGVYNWIISSSTPNQNETLLISSSANPFAASFSNATLTLISPNTEFEAYVFSVPMEKIVVPTTPLTTDGAQTQCYYENTKLQATLYTKKARTYPPGATSGSGTDNIQYGPWPYAVDVEEIIGSGDGVPQCYKMVNGVRGEKVDIGTIPGGQECNCEYMNYGS